MKQLKRFLARHWLTGCVLLGLSFIATLLYGYGTTHFLPKLSLAEVQSIQQSSSLKLIAANPLWLPYKLTLYLFQKVGISGTALRYVSALFTIGIVASFYALCRRFNSQRVSVLTTMLFGISATVLTMSRVATPAVLLLSNIVLIAVIMWFRTSHMKRFAPFIVFLTVALVLYSPGTFWFVALLTIYFWKDIPRLYKYLSKTWMGVGIGFGILLMTPLIYSFIKDTSLIKSWLLLPSHYSLTLFLQELKNIPAAFLYRSNSNPAYSLGRLPLLDAFTGTMVLLGFYSYRLKISLQRTIIYILSAAISIVLTCLNQNQLYLLLCLPFVYFLAAEGVGYLLTEWRAVFPRNPLARFVGTIFMSLAVFAACTYHMNRYFLAWVNAPETKHVYNQTIPK